MIIRPARPSELTVLQDIERSAGMLFAEIGMSEVANDDPPSLDELASFADAGGCWVAVNDNGPVGYSLDGPVDGAVHLHQLSVRHDRTRRGIGSALLAHVLERADSAVTLTTFVDVPWNGPYYLVRGFRCLSPDEETPGLRALRDEERARGLDRWPRACMRFR